MRNRGFSLIELVTVVAIVAILAAVALPLYQNHITRSQAARVMSEAGNIIAAVEVCLSEGRTRMGTALGECDPGATGSALMGGGGNAAPGATLAPGTDVPVITEPLTPTTTIKAHFGNGAHANLSGAEITWARSTDGSWSCRSTIGANWAPAGCPN